MQVVTFVHSPVFDVNRQELLSLQCYRGDLGVQLEESFLDFCVVGRVVLRHLGAQILRLSNDTLDRLPYRLQPAFRNLGTVCTSASANLISSAQAVVVPRTLSVMAGRLKSTA